MPLLEFSTLWARFCSLAQLSSSSMYAILFRFRTILKPRRTLALNAILLIPSGSLTSLPIELLSEVMYNLDWADVLHLRQVCKHLHSASCERSVWLDIFLRHSQVEPRPFCLEKPLQLYSSHELEALIVRWKAIDRLWSIDNSLPTVERPFEVKDKALNCSHLVKGGRWFLAGTIHGEIHYFDLDAPIITPRILISAPFSHDLAPNDHTDVQMRISVDLDYESPYLTFNLAVFTARYDKGRGQLRYVQIWHVRANHDESGRVSELVAQKLSSFLEEADCDICHMSLLGDQVAYSIRHFHPKPPRSDLVVVDWVEADGASLDYRRRVTTDEQVNCLSLIPGNGIICTSTCITLYDIDDLTETTSIVSNVSFEAPWKLFVEKTCPTSLSEPFCVKRSTRFLFTTGGSVGGLILKEGLMEVIQLWEGGIRADCVQLGYNCAVSFHNKQVHTITARWPDQEGNQHVSPKAINIPRGPRGFVDDVSGTIVLSSYLGDKHTLINFIPST